MSNEEDVTIQEEPLPEEPALPPGGRKRAEHLSNEEMDMAALAHASVVLGFITSGLAGIVVALLIWLSYKDRSDYVATQSLQAMAFQLLLVPVTIHAIAGSEDIIDAMDLRAFGVGPRTWLEQLQYRPRDYVLTAFAALLVIVSTALALFGGFGQLWVPSWALAWAGG